MSEAGGPANQSGILYQNSIAALYLGRLLDMQERSPNEQIERVRVEAPEHVDDIVVTFLDGHSEYHQAKEKLEIGHKVWGELWWDFERQFRKASFKRGSDRLQLWVGIWLRVHKQVKEIVERARAYDRVEDWHAALSQEQIKLLNMRIIPHLENRSPDYVHTFLRHIDVKLLALDDLEAERVRYWMPATNRSNIELFRLLRDRVGGKARVREEFVAGTLRQSLIKESPDLQFDVPLDIEQLKAALRASSALLRQHKHTISGVDQHIDRSVTKEIVDWAVQPEPPDSANRAIAMLLDRAGMGKTVVMRDVLCQLEAQGVDVWAIKADLQLSDIRYPEDIDRKLRLPAAPEQIVSRLARLSRVVILIDQLDALSLSLAHDRTAMQVTLDLIARFRRIPNVRILISCRTFDRKSDPDLRNLQASQEFNIPPLNNEEITGILSKLGLTLGNLTPGAQQLLQTPLHLDLFAQAITTGNVSAETLRGIRSLQKLYEIIWDKIVFRRVDGAPSIRQRQEVINGLTDYMAREQRVTVPKSLFLSGNVDSGIEKATDWLESTGVLVSNGNETVWVFMHQTFFDYCYARRFVEQGKDLTSVLLSSSQGLFERPLMIQIITYLRGYDHPRYIDTLRRLLEEKSLRLHLRDHLWRWFGALPRPTDDEWLVAQEALFDPVDPSRRSRFMNTANGNADWFQYLQVYLVDWLRGPDDKLIDRVVLPYLQSIRQIMAREVANLLRPFVGRNEQWNSRIHDCITLGGDLSPETIDLFEQVFYLIPGRERGYWRLGELAQAFPDPVCRMLHHMFEGIYRSQANRVKDAQEKGEDIHISGFFGEVRISNQGITRALETVSRRSPELFLSKMLPWLIQVIGLQPGQNVGPYFASDPLFYTRYDAGNFSIGLALFEAIETAAELLIKQKPDEFRQVIDLLVGIPYKTPQYLVTRIYCAAPDVYANDALSFLLKDRRRLDLDDNLHARKLIAAIVPYLDPAQFEKLESAILEHQPFHKRFLSSASHGWRVEQFRLLKAVPETYLSSRGKERLRELARKFVGYEPPDSNSLVEFSQVSSPIDSDNARKMSDRQWLRAMSKYSSEREHYGWHEGGPLELGRVLGELIKENPTRYYKLLATMPVGVDETYVWGIVDGIASSPAPPEQVWKVIRRFGIDNRQEVKRAIARASNRRAREGVPNDIVEMLETWVRQQPHNEEWWRGNNTPERLLHVFVNSDRGSTLQALVHVYWQRHDAEALDKLWDLFQFLATDPSIVMRVGASRYLRYMLQYDEARAVSLFERLVAEDDTIWEAGDVHAFLGYSIRTNFSRLRSYVTKMMHDERETVQENGARLACFAALSVEGTNSLEALTQARELMEAAVTGKTSWRRGAVHILVENLPYSGPQTTCQYQLQRLLDDEDNNVRDTIDNLFHSLTAQHFRSLRAFIEAYASSKSHLLGHFFAEFMLMYGLQDPEWSLLIVEMMLGKEPPPDMWRKLLGIEEATRFVLQVYMKSTDESLKSRAMDVFDQLTDRYEGYTNKVLKEFDDRI